MPNNSEGFVKASKELGVDEMHAKEIATGIHQVVHEGKAFLKKYLPDDEPADKDMVNLLWKTYQSEMQAGSKATKDFMINSLNN